MNRFSGILLVTVAMFAAGCKITPRPDGSPSVSAPLALAVPAGNVESAVLVGSGYQIYECRPSDGGFAWAFVAPEASLYGPSNNQVGKHYAGPTWEYGDGSKVKAHVLTQSPSSSPASIPQLLLAASESSPEGLFHGVTFVQRLRTFGGNAPVDGCSAADAGKKTKVQYSADYVFYKAR